MPNAAPKEAVIPWFGARKFARELANQVAALTIERDQLLSQLNRLGVLSVLELEAKKAGLESAVQQLEVHSARMREAERAETLSCEQRLSDIRKAIVATEDQALLQEAGIYQYRHPLTDAVAYESAIEALDTQIKAMTRKDGGSILATTSWTVNGSVVEGRAMVRDFSKLMLRAFNAEADNLVRGLKPYKLDGAIERLQKVASTIEKLGKTMQIRIAPAYLSLRVRELELTADFLNKQADEKEAERLDRERLREERKVQQEIARERARLEKEKAHYENALDALVMKGDTIAAERLRTEIGELDKAIQDVDYRAANIRAGYVYVISNIGSFGEKMVKVGLTRRLDPTERIKELSDASVPFNFDIHAVFFSKDAVGIETAVHQQLETKRVNSVNKRREFFSVTPGEVKEILAALAGDLLQFQEVPEALEYRQSVLTPGTVGGPAV
jgi:hypothetical protein